MRALTSGERALLAGDFQVYQACDVVDATGAWVDVSQLFGGDWLTAVDLGLDLDNAVGTATFVFAREDVVAGVGVVSLAPLVGSSPANNGGPLFDYERPIRFRTAVVAFGAARPAVGTSAWRHVFKGKITGIEAGGTANAVTITALDEGVRLADAQIRDVTTYSDDTGMPVEDVMEQIRTDWAPFTPPIVVPASPGWNIKAFSQEKGSVLAALRDKLALQIGYDFRFRWLDATTFAPVFQSPERDTPTVQATFLPSEYLAIPRLGGTGDEIRNIGRVDYPDTASGTRAAVTGQNAASIARFGGSGVGERWMEFVLGADSNIDTPVEAQALLDSALSDLGFPTVAVDIETMYWWPAEIGDYYLFGANGDQFTSDEAFAVVAIKHHLDRDQQRTTFTVRGVPAAAYQTWLTLPQSLGGTTDTTGPAPVRLKNFRVKTRTPHHVIYEWDGIEGAAEEIDVFLNTVGTDVPVSEVWPTDDTVPTTRITDLTILEFQIDYPDIGFNTYAEFLPLAADTLKAGDAERVTVNSAGSPPYFGNLGSIVSPTGLSTTLSLEVIDPQTFGGVLTAWLNHDAIDDADVTLQPDGTLAIDTTPYTVTGNDAFSQGFGSQQLMRGVKVHPNKSKAIYFEFVNARGITTGKRRFTIMGGGGIIDETGQLVDGALIAATQLAASIRPPIVVHVLPPDPASIGITSGNMVTLVDADHPTGKLYIWTDSGWKAVANAPDLDGQVVEQQIADAAITTAKTAAGLGYVDLVPDFAAPPSDPKLVLGFDGTSLKRWSGGTWTDAVPAVSITGFLTAQQIADATIGPLQLAAGAVTAAAVAVGAITSPALSAGAVTAAALGASSVTAAALAAGSVTAPSLTASAVTAGAIAANAVVASKIAAGAITASAIAAGAVTTLALAAGAVTANEIATGAITAIKMVAGTITSNEIAAGTITAVNLASRTITAANIATGALTANELAANSIIAGKIAAGAVSTNELAARAITAIKIATGTITANEIAARTITALNIAAGTLTANEIAAGTITGDRLVANTITASLIAASAITTNALAAGAVTASKLTVSVLSGPGGMNGGGYVDLGIVISGRLNALSSGAYLDLNATGANAILFHPAIALYANGNGALGANLSVAGTITSDTFTAQRAQFSYALATNWVGDGVSRGFLIFDTVSPPSPPQYATRIESGTGLRTTFTAKYGLDLVTQGSNSVGVYGYLDVHAGLTVWANQTFYVDVGCRIGVFGAFPVSRQSVNGDRQGNPALASLLAAFTTYGWIVDNTF